MKTTLIEVLWKKEQLHWKRVWDIITKKFNYLVLGLTFGVIISTLVTLAHYAFAIMHTLFEVILWVFARERFKRNLQSLALKV